MAELWAGYLEKKTRSMFSGWQVRYFVLFDSDSRSATLKYWDTEKAFKLKPQHARGEIALLVNPEENRTKMLPGRTWEFRSRDQRQIEKCIAAFKQLADRRAAQMQQDSAAERKPQTEMPAMVDHSNYDTNPGFRPRGVPTLHITPHDNPQGGTSDAPGIRWHQIQKSENGAPLSPRLSKETPSELLKESGVPGSVSQQLSAVPPPPPPRNVGGGMITPRGGMITPRAGMGTPRGRLQSAGAPLSPRDGNGAPLSPRDGNGAPLSPRSNGTLLTPRSRAPPVPMLNVDFQNPREPKEAQQIQTMDGIIYFRAATKVSPRHYKSFTARKFLQPDISSDEEEDDPTVESKNGAGRPTKKIDDASEGEGSDGGALLNDDDLLELFMKKQNQTKMKNVQAGDITKEYTPLSPRTQNAQAGDITKEYTPLSPRTESPTRSRIPAAFLNQRIAF